MFSLCLPWAFCTHPSSAQMNPALPSQERQEAALPELSSAPPKVQLAILLDTSLSMKGLANQAQFQIWNVVSELASAERNGEAATLEIAVYDYGNPWNDKEEGFVGQVIPFTSDLDQVSRALFSVRIDPGRCGKEYCGTAIAKSLSELDWSESPATYRTIVIAGNEPFDQGTITLGESLPKLTSWGIPLNTIYCLDPNYSETLKGEDQWRLASELTQGRYAKVNHNHHLPDVMTPFDEEMRELNERLNETFMWYGDEARSAMQNQRRQDENAQALSDHAFAARMSAKIGHLYQHIEHDLIDAHQHGHLDLAKLDLNDMPESLRGMSRDEMMSAIGEMAQRRERIRREMANTLSNRNAFLHEKMSETLGDNTQQANWGSVLIEAIREQGAERGFQFKDSSSED